MSTSSKIFPAIVFLLVIVTSLTLLLYPELVYDILIWVIGSFQAGGLPFLFGMMIIQAIAIPIPSELVLIAGGLAFGFPFGWLVDAISYSAGLTTMKLKNFMIPTIIGTLPRALFYTSLGTFFGVTFQQLIEHYRLYGEIPPELQNMVTQFNYVLLGVVAVIAVIFVVYWLVTRRYTAEKEN
jgi:uncharacterized membrane protein YdjX (TVP38/TMEM64 family)